MLVIVSGLPGAGTSTLADALGRELAAPVLSVDPIEAANWRSGIEPSFETGVAAYEVAAVVATHELRLGRTVIVDAESPVEVARQMWRDAAARAEAMTGDRRRSGAPPPVPSPPMDDRLIDHLEQQLGARPVAWSAVSGGDVARARRVELDDRRIVFVKTHDDPPDGFFTTEAAGLWWLAEASSVAVPEVLSAADDPAHLALAWIDEGTAHDDTEPELGRGLAALHRSGAPSFGREDRRTTGSRGLPNEPCETWVEFYASQRLIPLARLARDGGALDASTVRRIDRVADRLDELGGDPEPPSRLHGDLWAGNRLIGAGGESWLIDPAAHGGHREFDLAMMRLFGGFGPECFGAYEDACPLGAGWEERVPLHQLAPLIVHAIKFGGGYVGATEDALARLR